MTITMTANAMISVFASIVTNSNIKNLGCYPRFKLVYFVSECDTAKSLLFLPKTSESGPVHPGRFGNMNHNLKNSRYDYTAD